MNTSWLSLVALAAAARAVRVGQPAQRAGSREVVARASATATAAAAYSTWADLASEPQLLPEAQAARTVMEVSPIAQLCLASSADGIDGTVCAHLVAGSPSRPEPVRLAGGDQIFGVDEDGSPLFGLRPGSQAALDLAASASVSFAAHAPTGGAQAGCAVTLLGPAAEAELPADLAKKLARQTGVGKEELEGRQWWRLSPRHVHFTDALHERDSWVSTDEYATAEANPLAESLGAVIAKLNANHAADLARLAGMLQGEAGDAAGPLALGEYAAADEETLAAEILSVDPDGFDLGLRPAGKGGTIAPLRIGLRAGPQTREETLSIFSKLFQETYARQQGWQ
mmetsp:Transcript_33248/g.104594  ORF Transcript_33248/g.104594 Transcript_33248/m.104594 type:complete len:340 (+) Transcript_33248:20-1039(+)